MVTLKNILTEMLGEDYHLLDITDKNEMGKYINKAWDILQSSYSDIGGFLTYKNKNEMINRCSRITIYTNDNINLSAVSVYTSYLGGRKMVGIGSDNTNEGKTGVREIIQRDINECFSGWYWAEVSDKIESLFKKYNGNPIPSSYASTILKNNNITIIDEVHYNRPIGKYGDVITKMIFGFKDNKTYESVMEMIDNYDNFKNEVNSTRYIKEDKTFDDRWELTLKLAVYIVIKVSNIFDDFGIQEFTPFMYAKTKWAYNILKVYDNKENNEQIKSCLELSEYYLNNYDVMELHKF